MIRGILARAAAGAALVCAATVVAPTPASAVGTTGVRRVIDGFSINQGWRVDRHLRILADITGDGRADIVGFGGDGVTTAVSNGDGTFTLVFEASHDFGFDQGWRIPTNPRFVTDVTGDGRADIVGIGNNAVMVAVALGNGGFAAPLTIGNGFLPGSSYFMADVNADNRADLYRVSQGRVDIAVALGNGSFAAPILATTEFSFPFAFDTPKVQDVTGDRRAEFLAFSVSGPIHIRSTSPRTDGTYPLSHSAQPNVASTPQLMDTFADITGDGRADIVAFGQTEAESHSAVSIGGGNFRDFAVASDGFGAGSGWNRQHPRQVIDLNADGRADIVGFGIQGVWIALSNGNGTFAPGQLLVGDLGSDQGWNVDQHVRVAADITGDGRADMVGFGAAGVYTAVTTP
ncbi:FG-GAP repeat domain-containing protein [Catenuloplanes japonicus]|uniref:FG-GAP repeat domain-containing protein n=1 Tax=Catenuloplanes japonicus TaxID=33876 RepID=UPI00068FB8EF|nr:VCBS repeat-containing protein [Catenuloplanes japonicus]